jgi:hypothetical protein
LPNAKAFNMSLRVLKDGKAFASESEMPGKCGWGEDIWSVRALKKDVVNIGWWVVGLIKV